MCGGVISAVRLNGFTIANFRNFGEEEQWVAPLARINIFIGSNNSGKSNVLRYVNKIVIPGLNPNRLGINLSTSDRPINGASLSHFWTKVPLEKLANDSRWQSKWNTALVSTGVLDADNKWLNALIPAADLQGLNAGFPIEAPYIEYQDTILFSQIWNFVTGSSAGDYEAVWYPQSMARITHIALEHHNVFFIPSFRQIPSRLDEFHDEYAKDNGGVHVIEKLAAIAYPNYLEMEKTKDFETLRQFIGELIEDEHVEIQIPSDRKTINVKTNGNFLPVEMLGSGIHELVIIASEILVRKEEIILLEEPEVHLHPSMQKRLMNFILNSTSNQFFITTHSASIIDTKAAHIFGVSNRSGQAKIERLLTSQQKFSACRSIGYRASDLLQTNCIIWVEGPSDRIYLVSWLNEKDPDLREGEHFTIMFYGGILLSHLTLEDESFGEFINILSICRHAAILLDSDRASENQNLRPTKVRILDEIAEVGGFSWVTAGREIENFYSNNDRDTAIREIHPSAVKTSAKGNRYAKPIDYDAIKGGKLVRKTSDKVKLATYLTSHNFRADPSKKLHFSEKMEELVNFIHTSNS